MKLLYKPISFPEDKNGLVEFLTGEEWPFHVNARLSKEQVMGMINEGAFDGSNHESFWIQSECSEIVGFFRLFDLDDIEDGYPLFDLRVSSEFRGQGVGKATVSWLTRYLFDKHSQLDKIIGTTRADNLAMRKTFRSCGFVKEGHYRKDWCSSNGQKFDTVKYGILREDWVSGRSTPVNWDDGT